MKKIIFLLIATASQLFISKLPAQEYSNIVVAFDPEHLKTEGGIASYPMLDSIKNYIEQEYDITLKRVVEWPESLFLQKSKIAIKNTGNDKAIQKLKFLYYINSQNTLDFETLKTSLGKYPAVRYVEAEAYLPQPPADIPPPTPDYNNIQGYLRADSGIDMEYAWSKGIFGQNVPIMDIEYGVNLNHEKLEDQNVSIMSSMTVNSAVSASFSEHGTATVGVLYADKFNYGQAGLVHGAPSLILVPEYTVEHGYNRVLAVTRALERAAEGSVILYEMQTGVGSSNDYVPADFNTAIWDLTKAGVDAGIVIVAAAGNGGVDLDNDPRLTLYKNRGDNGSIIVGAGSPDMEHRRLNFSTYGSRVNLQGWGSNVISSGYGDFASFGVDINQDYTKFSGTSSATPIVAAAAVAVQSYYYSYTNDYLNCRDIRKILFETGTPQGNPQTGNIGPLPNVKRAFNYVDSLVATLSIPVDNNTASMRDIQIFPNPSSAYINVGLPNNLQIKTGYIFSATGSLQTMFAYTQARIDIANLKPGQYELLLMDTKGQVYKGRFTKI